MGTTPLLLEHVVCNLCGCGDEEVLFQQNDLLTNYPEPFKVVRCRQCELVYVNPRPRLDDLGQFYTPEFVSYQFESTVSSEQATWRDRLMVKMTQDLARDRIRKIRRFVDLNPQSRVLDIGCGKGHFLNQLKQEWKCEVSGLDIDESSTRYCSDILGISVTHGNATALETQPDRYDLVTMWHYLEHESDPSEVLAKVRMCLKPGGLLVIEVPNQASFENQIFGRRSYLYDVPRHLYDFAPATMEKLLTKASLEMEHLSCTSSSGGWLGSVQQLLTNGRVYRNLKQNIGTHILFWLLFGPIDYVTSFTRRGSIMIATARKASV